jgi:hypothetical protein
MFSDETVRLIIAGALLLHGLAHAIALLGLFRQGLGGESRYRLTVRSWLIPGVHSRWAAFAAVPFWAVATLGFLGAAFGLSGTTEVWAAWRDYAVIGAIASLLGIGLFSGIWPGAPNKKLSMVDTAIAAVMDVAILAALLWFGWPPVEIFGV